MKKCCKCKRELDISNFYKNKTKKGGLCNVCKDCTKEKWAEWHKNNKDFINKCQRIKKKERTQNGLCRHCLNKQLSNSKLCKKHWFEDVSYHHFKTTKYGKLLEKLAKEQKYKCIYTDETLIPGTNMSLDHRISKFDNIAMAKDLNNVQWVTKDINIIKNKLSHQNFISLCKKIYIKFHTKKL